MSHEKTPCANENQIHQNLHVIINENLDFWSKELGWVEDFDSATPFGSTQHDLPPGGAWMEAQGDPYFEIAVCTSTQASPPNPNDEDLFFKERFIIQNFHGAFWASEAGWVGHPKFATAFARADTGLPPNGHWIDLWENEDIRYRRFSEQINSSRRIHIQNFDRFVLTNETGNFWSCSFGWVPEIERADGFSSPNSKLAVPTGSWLDLWEEPDLRFERSIKLDPHNRVHGIEVAELGLTVHIKFYDGNRLTGIPKAFYRTFPKMWTGDPAVQRYIAKLNKRFPWISYVEPQD